MTEEEKLHIEEETVKMLKTVFDPEIPVDIYSLGLVYKIDVDNEGNALFKKRHTQVMEIEWLARHEKQRELYEAVTEYVRNGYNKAIRERKNYIGFLMILFQPELRRALEKFGRTRLGVTFLGLSQYSDDVTQNWERAIKAICEACGELSATCTGALIVIERQVKLGEQIETGTILDAIPSKELFGNIFFTKTPLHDGAVIMRNGIIHAAACFLPKPQNDAAINKKLGSRHRAAIGMSENSDSVVIVVSEETGQISVAMNGVLTRDYNPQSLNRLLHQEIFFTDENGETPKKGLSSIIERRKKK